MELVFGVIVGLIILVILVVLHEFGHAVVARRNGVIVEEFGIGFPPKVWSRKLKNGVEFSLNWLPLGGFVKLQGEHDAANKKGDYGAASFWVKTKILLAGVFVNWITAVVLFTILAWTGLPKVVPDQFNIPSDTKYMTQPVEIATVGKDSPAEKAGLKIGDKIVRFAGEPIPDPEALNVATKAHKGENVEMIYSRADVEHSIKLTLRDDNAGGQGYLGVGSGQRSMIRVTWSAPIVGVVTTGQLTGATFAGLGNLLGNLGKGIVAQFSGDANVKKAGSQELETAKDSVAGPIGILGVIFPAAQQAGPTQLTLLTALISLTLAVMNVLPIPALDGGRWFTMVLFRLLKKPLTKEREENIQAVGFMCLMALIVVVTFADVSKLFK